MVFMSLIESGTSNNIKVSIFLVKLRSIRTITLYRFRFRFILIYKPLELKRLGFILLTSYYGFLCIMF